MQREPCCYTLKREVSDFLALELDAIHTSFNGRERPERVRKDNVDPGSGLMLASA